jgi:hypothetical protein
MLMPIFNANRRIEKQQKPVYMTDYIGKTGD